MIDIILSAMNNLNNRSNHLKANTPALELANLSPEAFNAALTALRSGLGNLVRGAAKQVNLKTLSKSIQKAIRKELKEFKDAIKHGRILPIFEIFYKDVYSNTGGQASKATPLGAIAQFASAGKASSKKDLGLMAMSYRSIYVAQVALAADKAQTLKAFMEAEAYPGPSIIIAYAPCINHGIRGGLTNSAAQVKEAVEVGYWPLFRYNPLLSAGGGNPFQLDSKAPQGDFAAHLANEVRYSALRKQFPERADALFASAEKAAMARYTVYAKLANTVK